MDGKKQHYEGGNRLIGIKSICRALSRLDPIGLRRGEKGGGDPLSYWWVTRSSIRPGIGQGSCEGAQACLSSWGVARTARELLSRAGLPNGAPLPGDPGPPPDAARRPAARQAGPAPRLGLSSSEQLGAAPGGGDLLASAHTSSSPGLCGPRPGEAAQASRSVSSL